VVSVHRPVTIAVAGAHSTGKSTFLAKLARELCRRDLRVAIVGDLGEQAQRAGFPILAQHTWASTLWIITRGISNELAAWIGADIVLIDRPSPTPSATTVPPSTTAKNNPTPPPPGTSTPSPGNAPRTVMT
jgi:hypothetical protein